MKENNEQNNQNPSEQITLLNGRTLLCYPKQEIVSSIDNSLKLDSTGQYLSVGRSRPTVKEQTEEEKQKELKDKRFFTDHAFFFLDHREQILRDSRMFLAPVPIQSGLAYTGTSGFHKPTLGVYIEWWLNCIPSIIGRYRKETWLVYHIAGSPLSGSNSCGIVNSKGECRSEHLPGPFRKLWGPFMDINSRYDSAKSKYEAYSLEEVVQLLKECDEGETLSERTCFLLQRENVGLREKLDRLQEYYKKELLATRQLLLKTYFECKRDELTKWYDGCCSEKEDCERQIAEYKQRQQELRQQLESGEIDNVFYQQRLTPLRKKTDALKSKLERIGRIELLEILKGVYDSEVIPLNDVIVFLNGKLS